MIGRRYWSTGITVTWTASGSNRGPGWGASLKFFDDGFCDDDTATAQVATQGELASRYHLPDDGPVSGLTVVLDVLIADAARLGIEFRGSPHPSLYVKGDGEDPDVDLPGDWHDTLKVQAARLGWETYDRVDIPQIGGRS